MNEIDRIAGIAGDVFAAAGATTCRKKDVRMCIRWGAIYNHSRSGQPPKDGVRAAIACKRTRTVQPSRAGQHSDRNSIATEARESRLW